MSSTINKLKQRGIYDSAIGLGCTIEGDKLFIPICDLSGKPLSKRVKNFGDGLKYFWSPSKPKNPIAEWFIAPKTKQAIADNNGICYLANGEPAMLAMIAANVQNVICSTLSEISVPKNIIELFESLGIKELRYLKDKDNAGNISAIKWRDALLTSDVKFTPYDMPSYLEKKDDINDLWIYHDFSSGNFQHALKSLNRAMLPLPEVKPLIEYDAKLADTPQSLIDAIISRLGIQHFNSDGWSHKKVESPFRDDKTPSFNLNRNTGVGGDWGTGQYYSPYAIAKELNIQYSKPSYKRQEKRQEKRYVKLLPSEEPIEYKLADSKLYPAAYSSWVDSEHLPLSWLRALLSLSDSRSAVTPLIMKLHAALRQGKINSKTFTIAEICKVLEVPRGSTTSALNTLIEWGYVRDNGAYSIYKESTNYLIQNSKGGKPAKTYSITTNDTHTLDNRYPVKSQETICLSLLSRLEIYVIEHHTGKAIAPRMHTLFQELDLSKEDLDQWRDRITQSVSDEIAYKIKADMRHWSDLLIGDDWSKTIDYDAQCNPTELRALILTEYLNRQMDYVSEGDKKTFIRRQKQMSQADIMRLVGLKSPSFKKLFKEAKVTTELRYKWHSVDKPNTCNLKQELNAATQAKNNDGRGGHLVWMSIKPIGGKYGKPIYKRSEMLQKWDSLKSGDEDKPTIFGINIRVQLPSLVRFKTAQELADDIKAEKQKELEKEQAQEIVAVSPVIETSDTTQADTVQTPKKRTKPRYSTRQDRTWDKHDEKWLHMQLRAETYVWLNQDLDKLGLVGASNIIKYINEQIILHKIDKPYHTASEFFDSDELDFEVTMPDNKKEQVTETPLPAVDKPKSVKSMNLTLEETRAWGRAKDKQGYLDSIGMGRVKRTSIQTN